MSALIDVVFPVLLVAAVAFAVQPILRLEPRTLSRATFYLFNPALVLWSLARSDVSGAEVTRIGVAVLTITLLLWGLGALLARMLGLRGPLASAFLLATLIGNTGNYGLPVALFAFGEGGLARATIFYVGSSILQASLGVFIAARGQAGAREALLTTLRVPVLYAACLGLAMNLLGLTFPGWLDKSLSLLAQGTVPTMLCLLGVQLATMLIGETRLQRPPVRSLVVVTVTRLIAAPLLALPITWLLGFDALTRSIVLLQSAMPTAVISITVATEFQADVDFATAAVFLTTVVSLGTVTMLLNWLLP